MLNAVSTNAYRTAEPQTNGRCAPSSAKAVYFALLDEHGGARNALEEPVRAASQDFLAAQLASAAKLSCDLPGDARQLADWIDSSTEATGRAYRAYLNGRKAGGGRRYFKTKSQALYFLKSVAPTKLVDGAWLYGLLQRWDDRRFASLIRIYLEELGDGVPEKNHVVLYRKLIESHGCDQWHGLSDDHFIQGAIQLSLAHHAADFLPEVIGFNLGYEQLPLHLPITAYELNELGIDPYYFTLHVTIDNAASGHARKSAQGVLDALPRIGDADDFYRRVMNGYKLNMLGKGTEAVIKSFDLATELLSVFAAKASAGSQAHSDYCRVGGKTVNEWLSEPHQLPAFLEGLERMGWIKRHQDPQNSRFWKLIHGDRAEMFGVFNAYEQQLIHDWIVGDAEPLSASRQDMKAAPRTLSFRNRQRLQESLGQPGARQHSSAPRAVIRQRFDHQDAANDQDDFNAELRTLEEKIAALSGKDDVMRALTALMSPAHHPTPAGLMATRMFRQLFG